MSDVDRLTTSIPKTSVDYVVDIESSFFYPNKAVFLREVREVLKDDGTFFFGTLILYNRVKALENLIKRNFDIEHQEDITSNVVRSLKLDSDSINRFIDRHYPWGKCYLYYLIYTSLVVRFFLKQAWGTEGTFVHWLIQNRYIVYNTYILKKKKYESVEISEQQ